MNKIDLTGKKFGRLVVNKIMPIGFKKIRRWECICDCGNLCYPKSQSLRTGITKSCGCVHKDRLKERVTTHGLTKKGAKKPLEYMTWVGLKNRCFNTKAKVYSDYGGRGITVCERWRESYESFLLDMGKKPVGDFSIDRIDNDKNYSCGQCNQCIKNEWSINCRWATDEQQASNKRNSFIIEYNGIKKTISAWGRELNTSSSVIKNRLKSKTFHEIYIDLNKQRELNYV